MKRLLLAGTAVLGLATSASGVHATLFDFTYTGNLVDFTVPTTDTYQILAFGAQGGNAVPIPGIVGVGGLGAEIGGNFMLTAGEVLQIAVGGVGSDEANGGGGGGGSFVVGPGNAPLVIAGGGGGGGFDFQLNVFPGQGGLIGPNGGGPFGGNGGNGGGGFSGGGGGGFFSAGGNGIFPFGPNGTGGGAFPDLAGGDFGGGFGGGGGAAGPAGGAGGGGGYSGGGGGLRSAAIRGPGGGGGSFDAGIDQILIADFQMGNGEVVITELVPEPASIALLGTGLAGFVAAMWQRRRRET